MTALDDLPPVGACVERLGLRAHKSLGQHFLFDLNLTRKIARAAGTGPGELVVEVGPGPGGLTRALLESGAKVIAVDKDTRFAPLLDEINTASDGALDVRYEDALRTNMATLGSHGQPLKIVSNLPYNVGTQLLINWLTAKPLFWTSLTLMFQREVAERIVAKPGSSAYGRLAVLTAAIADAHLLFDIPAAAFSPPPKVDSAVVHLTPKPENDRFADLDALEHVTRAAFGQRRKMLRASLKPCAKAVGLDTGRWLAEAEIAPTNRPEVLPPEAFFALARIWRKAKA